jgi:hypothetical protein
MGEGAGVRARSIAMVVKQFLGILGLLMVAPELNGFGNA